MTRLLLTTSPGPDGTLYAAHCPAGHVVLPPGDRETAQRAVQHAICRVCDPIPNPRQARRRATAQRLRAARQSGLIGLAEKYEAELAAIDQQLARTAVGA